MATQITPFLMFEGQAEAAMNHYVAIIPGSAIDHVERHGAEQPEFEGRVLLARFHLAGQALMCSDSPVEHGFTFTPASSLFVELDDQAAVDDAFTRLADGGAVLMPLDAYPFSARFGWVTDRFGVSWQLTLRDPR